MNIWLRRDICKPIGNLIMGPRRSALANQLPSVTTETERQRGDREISTERYRYIEPRQRDRGEIERLVQRDIDI